MTALILYTHMKSVNDVPRSPQWNCTMRRGRFSLLSVLAVVFAWLAVPLLAKLAEVGGDNVWAYSIGSDGALQPIAGSPFAAGSKPNSVAVDCRGKFVYVANGGGSNNVSAYSIAPNGALTPVPGSPFAAGSLPSFVVV